LTAAGSAAGSSGFFKASFDFFAHIFESLYNLSLSFGLLLYLFLSLSFNSFLFFKFILSFNLLFFDLLLKSLIEDPLLLFSLFFHVFRDLLYGFLSWLSSVDNFLNFIFSLLFGCFFINLRWRRKSRFRLFRSLSL
jgi:hypothetical protein